MEQRTLKKLRSGLVAALVCASGLAIAPLSSQALPAGSTKVTICHRTHSVTNPYRRITVSASSIVGGGNSKHGTYNGNHNDWSTGKFGNTRPAATIANVFDPNFQYQPNDKKWGDIVPDVNVSGNQIQNNFTGLNYLNEGLAIYNGTTYNGVNYAGYCKSMSAAKYVESELAANRTPQEIVDDLNEMDANEDLAVKEQLGGNQGFTTTNIQQIASVGAITNQPTTVAETTATLNGEFKIGTKTATSTQFVYGTDATCSTGTTVAATPTSAATGTPVSFNATGLTPGTTYYYKVQGTVDAGTDTEALVEGACVQFVVAQGAASGGTTTGGTTTGGATTGGAAAGGSTAGAATPNLPETGSSSGLGVVAAITMVMGLGLMAVRRRRIV